MKRWICMSLIAFTALYAESVDEALEGFDDAPVKAVAAQSSSTEAEDALAGFDDDAASETTASPNHTAEDALGGFDDDAQNDTEDSAATEGIGIEGLTGSLSALFAYAYHGITPHKGLSVAKGTLYLDYEHKFANGWKFKTNAKAYYDTLYDLRDLRYSREEKEEYRSEVRLYDAYLEGSLREDLDFKIGRQVVVWGRSDTIRITDVLNPLDNRRPALVDIEDLRLPVTMAKLDYYVGKWRFTPIAILEQQFSLNPPYGSAFYPAPFQAPEDKSYHDVTAALSVGAEFSGWDLNLYAARLRHDSGYIVPPITPQSRLLHDKVTMVGTAFNLIRGSWLFKGEMAHFKGVKYTSAPQKSFERTDALAGVEYNGIADTTMSYDFSVRHIHSYDPALVRELQPLEEDTYQHAFRVRSDFMNASLHANYLVSLYGKRGDQGGFQRLWGEYEINDALKATVGVIDYIGGSRLFDTIKRNDMLFSEITYSF